jgi:hypothetical protein
MGEGRCALLRLGRVQFSQSCFKHGPEQFCALVGIALEYRFEDLFAILWYGYQDLAHDLSFFNIVSECKANPVG